MKSVKTMIVGAMTLAFAFMSYAGIMINTNCNPKVRSTGCPVAVFKLTGSGKIAAGVVKNDEVYKTVSKLSITKGALVLFPEQVDGGEPDDCCYSAYSLYLQVKVGKNTVPVGVFYEAIDSWSIFGKEFMKIDNATKTKKFKVDTQIGLGYANTTGTSTGMASAGAGNDTVVAGGPLPELDLGLDDFAFIATAFGKGIYKYMYTKNPCSACAPGTEDYEYTPGNYSGWFAGVVSDLGGEYGCLMCNCADLDVFGGTWKAKYNKDWSKKAEGWEKAAAWVFGASVVANMKDAGVE